VAQARANRSDGKISRSDIDSRRSRATLSGGYNSSATTGAPSPAVILRRGRCVAGEVTEDEMRHDKRAYLAVTLLATFMGSAAVAARAQLSRIA
jgi:hypothetical protein